MSSAFRLSVGINVLLLAAVAALLWRGRPGTAVRPAPAVRAAAPRWETETPKPEAGTKRPGLKSIVTAFTPAAVAQLEQARVSRDVLISVLLEDLNRRSAKRALELRRRYAPRLVPDHEMRELARESDAEQIRELKAAFGEEGYLAWDKQQTLNNLNRARVPGDELAMSPAEADQAYRLQKDFDQKNVELQMAMEDGVADRADGAALQAQAQQALDRELEKLLGPQRFGELRGNVDPTTEVYRTYGDLNPTPDQANAAAVAESEYRTRESALTKSLADNPQDAAAIATELKTLRDAEDANLRQIFGADAYDNLKLQNDPTYQALKQYADTWDLKPTDVQSVYATIHAFQDQADRARSAAEMSEAAGQHVNWRDINAAIDEAQQQTELGLQNAIGPDRVQRLKQNGLLNSH